MSPERRPIVSSAHLVSEGAAALSELEYGLMVAVERLRANARSLAPRMHDVDPRHRAGGIDFHTRTSWIPIRVGDYDAIPRRRLTDENRRRPAFEAARVETARALEGPITIQRATHIGVSTLQS